ncbi:MAG: CmcI family methyltransferase [bacterium]|nr:CmcI family methyltransferase [bacterium]
MKRETRSIKKRIYTRDQFENMRVLFAEKMAHDTALQKNALKVLVKADQYNWIHQTNWFGEPILQFPQDMFAVQEIIYNTRPDYIVEIGVAWGGSLLFYSTIMEAIGGKKIIGVDIFIPEDLRKRIFSHGAISKRITLITGSSLEETTVKRIRSIIGKSKKVMVVLDSNHTHEHVLRELKLYSPLVGKGYYLVCGDTIIEDIPVQKHRPRPWGPGNNPKTALREFCAGNKNFKIDKHIENKLLFTCNPEGYLVRSKK